MYSLMCEGNEAGSA